MTTAHRPTFDPARGKEALRGPAYHQRLLPAHTQLKYRKAGQGGDADNEPTRDLAAELLAAEATHFSKKKGVPGPADDDEEEEAEAPSGAKRSLPSTGGQDADEEDMEAKRRRILAETRDIDADDSDEEEDSDDDDDDDDDSDDDSDAELQRELDRVRDRSFIVSVDGRMVTAVGRAEPDHIDEEEATKELDGGKGSVMNDSFVWEPEKKGSQLQKRVVFGLGIGISVGAVVLTGGWIFTVALAAAVFIGTGEYFELVRSRGIATGMTPPPQYVSRVCSIICALMPILTLYFGHIDVSVTSAAFLVAITLLLQRENPRFSQLSSAMFALFYCGYLPCFWVKLRCGLSAPALNTKIGSAWPVLLGGQAHWTVGLVATLISISSIIAADTFAFLGGKIFGRTPLTNISPKKTWEGAIAGLSGCIVTALVLSKVFRWPTSLLSAAAFGFLNFFGSIFGDLVESMIKRDAGVKDSGSLIPGHGGILDRTDSYFFTGSLAYSFVKTFLPLYGV